MNYDSYVNREFEILKQRYPDSPILKYKDTITQLLYSYINDNEYDLGSLYNNYMVLDTLERLYNFHPITELIEDDIISEHNWILNDINDTYYQHIRLPALRKELDGSIKYTSAIIFNSDVCSFLSNSVKIVEYDRYISSAQEIKLPFRPKSFYVDVIEFNGETVVKNISQLNDVFNYYVKPNYFKSNEKKTIET